MNNEYGQYELTDHKAYSIINIGTKHRDPAPRARYSVPTMPGAFAQLLRMTLLAISLTLTPSATVAITTTSKPTFTTSRAATTIPKAVSSIANHIKDKKDKALAASIGTLVAISTAATPPPPNDPRSKGKKTNGSKKLYEKGKIRVEVENNGRNLGDVHLQIKGDPSKYYYNPKDVQFYLDRAHTKLAPRAIQDYLKDKKLLMLLLKD